MVYTFTCTARALKTNRASSSHLNHLHIAKNSTNASPLLAGTEGGRVRVRTGAIGSLPRLLFLLRSWRCARLWSSELRDLGTSGLREVRGFGSSDIGTSRVQDFRTSESSGLRQSRSRDFGSPRVQNFGKFGSSGFRASAVLRISELRSCGTSGVQDFETLGIRELGSR